MSRSQQQDLAPDPKPGTVKVNGAGLMHWGGRAKAGEVHIYRMICDGTWNGIYTLSLIWLEGRTMYRHGEKPADNLTRAGIAEEASQDLQGRALAAGGSTPPPATNPMKPTPPRRQHAAMVEGWGKYRAGDAAPSRGCNAMANASARSASMPS